MCVCVCVCVCVCFVRLLLLLLFCTFVVIVKEHDIFSLNNRFFPPHYFVLLLNSMKYLLKIMSVCVYVCVMCLTTRKNHKKSCE